MNITNENIEVILYDYAEGNLSAEERKTVEKYLNLHPEYKEMLDGYDPMLKIPVENEDVFAQKEEFLRQLMISRTQIKTDKPQSEKKTTQKIILISRYVKWISGVAAVMLLFFAIKTFYNLQNTQQTALVSEVNQINEREIKDINDLKDFNQLNSPALTAKNNRTKPVAPANTDITEIQSESENISSEELPTDNDVNTVEEIVEEMNKDLFADNNVSVAQKEQENTETNENSIVKDVYLVANNEKKSFAEELIRKGINSALKTQPMQVAIEGIAKVVSLPKTKKILNLFNEIRNRKTKTIYSRKVTIEISNV